VTLPPDIWPNGKQLSAYGNVIEIEPDETSRWRRARTEIQWAPDSAGSPDEGSAATVRILEPGGVLFVHRWPNDNTIRYWRARHTAPGYADSDWTDWTEGYAPVRLGPEVPDSRIKGLTLYSSAGRLKGDVLHDVTADVLSSVATETGSTPNVTVKRSFTFDAQTRIWRLYRREDATNWPTTDGTQTGPLDETYFKGEFNALFVTSYSDDSYATNDIVRDIVIPLNVNGDRGTRYEASYTVTNTPPPQITSATRTNLQQGSDCGTGNRRKVSLGWATANASDGNQDMKIYERINARNWSLIQTITDPVTTTTYTRETDYYEEASGSQTYIDYKLELVTGAVVEDVEQRDEETNFVALECLIPE
jgi:hypothetical protein